MNDKKLARGTLQGNTELVDTSKITRQSRLFAFTSYNDGVPILTDDIQYIGWGLEICPTTLTPHKQGFVYFCKKMALKNAIKRLEEAHPYKDYKPVNIRVCDGTFAQNVRYCSKDGQYTELGDKPSPGARKDLKKIQDRIKEGETVDMLATEDPYLFHMYGRTMNKLEDLQARKKFRTEMTEGIWYYGATGTGKSHKAFENYSPETHYVLPNDNGWWDAYTQQDTVIINDFRGEISYNELLVLVDKWPHSVKRRNREPIPFISKRIIITSSLQPKKIYRKRDVEDDIGQLMRRFKVIELK
jgi:hypothetical protein